MTQYIANFIHNNKAISITALYIVVTNAVVYLPKREEVIGQPLAGVVYDYFRNVVTGIMQMVPNPKPKTQVGPVTDSVVSITPINIPPVIK